MEETFTPKKYYGGPLCQDRKMAWRKVHSPFVSRGHKWSP